MRNTPKILTYIVIVIVMEVPQPIKLLPGERLWKIEVNHALWSGGLGNYSPELCWWQISGEETRQKESIEEGGERDQSTFLGGHDRK